MSRRVHALVAILFATAVMFAAAAVRSEEPDPGRVLLDKIRELNRTKRKWTDSTQEISVTVYPRRGGEKVQRLRLMTKKYGDDNTRTMVSFLDPPTIRDVSVLQWVEANKPNQTWLYSPEFDRPRQYNGASQRASFSNTDFSYEDLSIRGEIADWTPEEAEARFVRDDTVDGKTCAVIEVTPKTVDVTYKTIRLWLDREQLLVRKFEFEEDKGKVAKTLLMTDIRDVGAIPTAHKLEMTNEREHSHTIAVLDSVTYDKGLDDSMFSQRYFEDKS